MVYCTDELVDVVMSGFAPDWKTGFYYFDDLFFQYKHEVQMR